MKTRPILFSSEMVRALLEGRKTQTRRIFKQATGLSLCVDCDEQGIAELSWLHGAGPGYPVEESIKLVQCPYGQPGDLLWVKETINRGYCGAANMSRYAADGFPTKADWWPWRRNVLASIHCPQGLSRITLRITAVRVERLQDISKEDAISEGATSKPDCLGFLDREPGWSMEWDKIGTRGLNGKPLEAGDIALGSARMAFANFIDKLHGGPHVHLKPELSLWDKNPWVWVVEFEVIHKNVLELLREAA